MKTCSCGHTINNTFVTAKTRYDKRGLFMLSMGFSAKPLEVIYVCQKCGEKIDSSTDETVIEKFRYNSDIIK